MSRALAAAHDALRWLFSAVLPLPELVASHWYDGRMVVGPVHGLLTGTG